jgi:hypothetical protein
MKDIIFLEKEYNDDILKELSLKEIQCLYRDIEHQIAGVNMQINEMKLKYINEGISGDHEWLIRAKKYKHLIVKFKNDVSVYLREKKENEKKQNMIRGREFDRYIIEVLKEKINRNEFDLIVKEAESRLNDNEIERKILYGN